MGPVQFQCEINEANDGRWSRWSRPFMRPSSTVGDSGDRGVEWWVSKSSAQQAMLQGLVRHQTMGTKTGRVLREERFV